MRPIETGSSLAALCIALAAPAAASAQARVTTLDGERWSDVVTDLVHDLDSEGRTIALCVRRSDTGPCLPCSAYTLALDAAASEAFALGACDEAHGATSLRLARRSALFDHQHSVPVPRTMGVTAELRAGASTESTTPRSAGSAVGCSVRVRPYVRDLEHGNIVYLGSDAYEVRVARSRFHVDPSDDGAFVITSTDGSTTEVEYDVVERETGTVMVVGHTMLSCESTVDVPATEEGTVAPIPTSLDLSTAQMVDRNAGTDAGSGIRIVSGSDARTVGDTLVVAGIGVVTVSAVTLIGIGIANSVQLTPSCTTYRSDYPGGPAIDCVAWSPARVATTPEELTWAALGTLGGGVVLGLIGWVMEATAASHDDRFRIALDLDANGGHLQVGGRF